MNTRRTSAAQIPGGASRRPGALRAAVDQDTPDSHRRPCGPRHLGRTRPRVLGGRRGPRDLALRTMRSAGSDREFPALTGRSGTQRARHFACARARWLASRRPRLRGGWQVNSPARCRFLPDRRRGGRQARSGAHGQASSSQPASGRLSALGGYASARDSDVEAAKPPGPTEVGAGQFRRRDGLSPVCSSPSRLISIPVTATRGSCPMGCST